MARYAWPIKSIALARESAIGTENTTDASFSCFAAEVEVPSYTQKVFDNVIATGKIGTHYPPVFGSRMGSVKLKFPLYGSKRGYDPEASEPGITAGVLPGTTILLGLLLGSNSDDADSDAKFIAGKGLSVCDFTASKAATYGAADVAAATSATQIDVGAGNGADYKAGQLFVCDSTKTAGTPSVSWIKTIATDTLTFADACANPPVLNDNTYATWTAHNSSQDPTPFTLRILGDNAALKTALIGCRVEGGTITLNAQEPPMVELEVSFIGVTLYNTGGGTIALTVIPQVPQPVIGGNGGRLTMGWDGGALAAVGGLKDVQLVIKNTFAEVPGHGSTFGILEKPILQREITLKFKMPRSTADSIVGGRGPFEQYAQAGTAIAVALYSGTLPGNIFSVFMPACHQNEAPTEVDDGGLIYWQVSLRPQAYTGDTGTTGPADSNCRIGGA